MPFVCKYYGRPCPAADALVLGYCDDEGLRVESKVGVVVGAGGCTPYAKRVLTQIFFRFQDLVRDDAFHPFVKDFTRVPVLPPRL